MSGLAREGDAKDIQRSSEAYWRKEYFRRNAGQEDEATCLDSATDASGAQRVILNKLGAIVDYRGSPLTAGEEVCVRLGAAGHVTRF